MFDVASTEEVPRSLSTVESDAARGILPDWSQVSEKRLEHIARVAELIRQWADELGLEEGDVSRWAAAAWLHDAVKDQDPEQLRELVSEDERDLPGPILHGPAAATLLGDNVDHTIVAAVRHHTLGHPDLDKLGRALYLADFLEPGRKYDRDLAEALRARMPGEMDAVLVDVIAARIGHSLERRQPIFPATAAFWSASLTGAS